MRSGWPPTQSTSEQVLACLARTFPEVRSFAVLDGGAVVASQADVRPADLGRSLSGLFCVAERAAVAAGAAPATQVVVDTADGAVAAVRQDGRAVVAVLRPHSSRVGLLLYELRRALHASTLDDQRSEG